MSAQELPKGGLRKNPMLQGLPEYLKRPENYEKVQRAIFEAGASTCDHADVGEWAGCVKCQKKQWQRKELMRRLGFQSGQQYLLWKQIHERIRNGVKKQPIEKYDS